jgi:hypothetical protein
MQPLAQPARPPFSWRKGWLHVSAVAGLLVALGVIAFALTSSRVVQVRIVSEITESIVWSIPLILAASYAYQTRRKLLVGMLLVLAGILALALLRSLLQTASYADNAPLTAGERERPARDAQAPRLCQAALGFSFPDPGPPYAPDPAAEEKLQSKDTPDTIKSWAWKGSGVGVIIVQAFKGTGDTETSFRDFAGNVETGITAAGHMSPPEKSLRWMGDGGELTLTTARLDNRVQVHIRCLSRGREGDRPPLAVCLHTYTGAGDPLRTVRAGLSVSPCGR